MKKLSVLAVAILLLVTGMSLSAQSAQKPMEITFWSLFTGGDGDFFDAMVKAFNASQNEIVMKTDTVKFDSYYTKLTAALAAKTAPDVVVVHQDHLSNFVPNGVLLPLDSYIAKAGIDMSTFAQGPVNNCKFDGKLYAIPMDVHPLIMYYNLDLFAKAGIKKAPVTLAELIADAEAVQQKTGAIGIAADNTTATYKAYTLTRMFMSMLMEEGYTTLNADNTKANFNNEAGIKAYQVLSDMVNKYKVTPKGLDYDSSVADFKLGKAAIHFNGVWVTGSFEQQPGLNFAAVKFPALLGNKSAAWSGSHTFAVPVQKTLDEKRVMAVMKFINWMTNHGYMWAKAGHVPTRSTATNTPEFKALPHRSGYADAVNFAFATPQTPKWGQANDAISDSLEESIALNRDAKSALAKMEQTVNDILSR
jgi:multiple sugar transport system substrate-binding protein